MPQDDKVQERFERLARRIGLRLDKVVRAGSEGNMAGIQTEQVLFSQRLDSRTYFVQDQRYGEGKELGTFGGDDREFIQRGLEVLKGLEIPADEIAERTVLREQTQAAEFDRQTGRVMMEDPRAGNRRLLLTRQVRKLPVWSSNVVLGLTKDGQIGFLQLHWPEIPDAVVDQGQQTCIDGRARLAAARASRGQGRVDRGGHRPFAGGRLRDGHLPRDTSDLPRGRRDDRPQARDLLRRGRQGTARAAAVREDRRDASGTQEAGGRGAGRRAAGARGNFKALLLGNENYFGNLPDSQLPPQLIIKGNTAYEEICCVGYEPQLQRLEATINIKRQTGYGGDICSAGTPEFVRFYLSFDNGATWVDQGISSFTAFDIPGPKPLAYDVTLHINPARRFCFTRTSRGCAPSCRGTTRRRQTCPASTPSGAKCRTRASRSRPASCSGSATCSRS